VTQDSAEALAALQSGTQGLEDNSFTPTFERVSRFRDKLSEYTTSPMERFLIMTTIVILPLQDHIPSIAGFSVMWVLFALLAGYVLLNRPSLLGRIWTHPVLLSAYVFLFTVTWVESLHPDASYREIFSIAQMFVGAMFLACLCRDRPALRAAVYGYVLMSLWLSVYLMMTTYGTLSGAAARDFHQASLVRNELHDTATMHANMNNIAAQILPGLASALALGLAAGKPNARYPLFAMALFFAVASFLTMSRGGAAGLSITCATVFFASGLRFGKLILAGGVFAFVIAMAVPDVVWQRMTFSTEAREGRQEIRARLYNAAIEHFPEYALMGIGAGNYKKSWGTLHGFYPSRPGSGVVGAHNAFFQVAINWGLPGLLLLFVITWKAYWCLPRRHRPDTLRVCLLGVAVSCLLLLLTRHSVYDKEYSLLLGLLVGAHCWIWPVSGTGVLRRG
jgi:O-antigen ligase